MILHFVYRLCDFNSMHIKFSFSDLGRWIHSCTADIFHGKSNLSSIVRSRGAENSKPVTDAPNYCKPRRLAPLLDSTPSLVDKPFPTPHHKSKQNYARKLQSQFSKWQTNPTPQARQPNPFSTREKAKLPLRRLVMTVLVRRNLTRYVLHLHNIP